MYLLCKDILRILGTLLASVIIVGCNFTPKAFKSEGPGAYKQEKVYPGLGKVAYIQKGNLWVKSLPDGFAKQLTTDGIASSPRWSVSGKWLLFQKKDQLWITGSDGSNCRLVADKVNAFTWSSTDHIFYYGTEKNGLVSVRPETMKSVVLIKPSPGEVYGRMVNSPDGRYIAFERFQPAAQESGGIWKLDVADGKVLPLFKAQEPSAKSIGVLPHLAGWSSDGKTIYLWVGPQSASLTADGVAFTAIDADTGKNLLADNQETGSLVHKNWFAPSPDSSIASLKLAMDGKPGQISNWLC